MQNHDELTGFKTYLALAVISAAGLGWQILIKAQELGVLRTSLRWQSGILFSALVMVAAGGLLAYSFSARGRELAFPRIPQNNAKILAGLYLLLAPVLLEWIFLGGWSEYFREISGRWGLFTLLALGGAFLIKVAFPGRSWPETLAFSALWLAFFHRLAMFLPDISTAPLSLSWSETSRYYYASLFFSKQIYGISLPPPVMHPSRYMLQSLAFLVPDAPIWFHRAWQVFLWISLPLASVYLLARHLRINDRWVRWTFIFYAFLFIFQGPIYYHLMPSLIIVLLGYRRDNFGRTLIVVLVASVWAGLSRVNWIPAPGALAALLYLLEKRVDGERLWRYLLPPVGWMILGGLTGIGAQFVYAALSGNALEQFSTSFTSDLLWYRLWPSATSPQGIFPTSILVSLPLFVIIGALIIRQRGQFHPIRLLGVLSLLLVFFTGGLVVSVKIGGGNNLHNLDVYLFFLLVTTAALTFGRVETETERQTPGLSPVMLMAAVIVPILVALPIHVSYARLTEDQTDRALWLVNQFVEKVTARDGEILFIAERQLLTFGMVEGVELIPEYERTYLMEMAMGRVDSYLERFYKDLANQRFDLIIVQPLNTAIKSENELFGEENNAWVRYISEPILCYYDDDETFRQANLEFMIPHNSPKDCPYRREASLDANP